MPLTGQARLRFIVPLLGILLALQAAAPVFAKPFVDQDTDGDLLPDQWERDRGFDVVNPADAEQDSDGDRLTTRDEYFAGTDPHAADPAGAMSDRQLLDLFAGKAALYFWEQSRAPYHFTADNADYNSASSYSNNFNSIATTGFGLMAYVMGDERGWLPHHATYNRIHTLLARAVALQASAYDRLDVPPSSQGNRHGYLYHFVDNNGFRVPGTEISTVDHAFLVAGALAAAEYYKGTDRKSTRLNSS